MSDILMKAFKEKNVLFPLFVFIRRVIFVKWPFQKRQEQENPLCREQLHSDRFFRQNMSKQCQGFPPIPP
jgi:hypothetical protein